MLNAIWVSKLGIFYEYYTKAGPRSCNGWPCFSTIKLLNKHDWKLAQKAIQKEISRRENFDMFDDTPEETEDNVENPDSQY